jgi:hypothetical protein
MFTTKLQWIDETDPESIRQSRIHRQKEFHRAKRWKQVQQWQREHRGVPGSVGLSREQSSSFASQEGISETGSGRAQDSPPAKQEDVVPDNDDADVVDEDGTILAYSSRRTHPDAEANAALEELSRKSLTRNICDTHRTVFDESSLSDLLASSRRDPFGTLPFASAPDTLSNRLVSHCKNCCSGPYATILSIYSCRFRFTNALFLRKISSTSLQWSTTSKTRCQTGKSYSPLRR